MRCIMVGFGRVAETDHLPVYLKKGIEVVAIVDVSTERFSVAKTLLPNCRFYNDLDTALNNENVDFCDIAAPPYAHASMVDACIRHKTPVICEKPFLTNRDQLLKVLDTIKEYQSFVFPCHTWLFAPQIIEAFRLINANQFLTPVKLHSEILRTAPAKGTLSSNSDWRINPQIAGGGILMDHGYHLLYLAQALLQSYPLSVKVISSQKLMPESVEFEIEFELHLASSKSLPLLPKILMAKLTWAAPERSTSYKLIGEDGTLLIKDATTVLQTVVSKECRIDPEGGLTYSSLHSGWFEKLFDYFLNSWKAGRLFHDELLRACYTMEVIWACYESISQNNSQITINSNNWLPLFTTSAT